MTVNKCWRTIAIVLIAPCIVFWAAVPKSLAAPKDPTSIQLTKATVDGLSLSDAQAQALEKRLARDANDPLVHAQLLGYYAVNQFKSHDAAKRYREHALWLIENFPANEFCGTSFCEIQADNDIEGYWQGRDLWHKMVEKNPNSTAILSNAANFMASHNPDQAESLLDRATKVDPKNPRWLLQLAVLRINNLSKEGPGGRRDQASLALAELEKALTLTTDRERQHFIYKELPKTAFLAGDMDKAKTYADRVLKEADQIPHEREYGEAIFVGNMVLGEVALSKGDVASADRYLLASAKTPGSGQLGALGPNPMLARDLLAKGERETVLQYFQLCRKFWKLGGRELDEWTAAVKAGDTPNWGTTLDIEY